MSTILLIMGAVSSLVVLVVLGLVLAAPNAKTTSENLSSPSRLTRFKNWYATNSQNWLKVALAGGILLLLLYYWDRLNVLVALWLADSVVGTKLNLEASSIADWLWVPAMLLVAYILYRMFRTKKEGVRARRSGTSVKDFINGIIDFVVVVIFLGVIAFVVLLVGGIIIKVAGIDTAAVDMFNAATGKQTVRCTQPSELAPNPRIDRGGRDIIICAKQAGMIFEPYPLAGYDLEVVMSPLFEGKHLLGNGRTIYDFIQVNPPSVIPHGWQIVVKDETWHASNLDHIRLHLRAIPR